MAKLQIKSKKLTTFGGIFSIAEQFDALLSQTTDATLGLRCKSHAYRHSGIFSSLKCVYFCGGHTHKGCIDTSDGASVPAPRAPNMQRRQILRAIEELTCKNTAYTSASGKSYDSNAADKMNELLIKVILATLLLSSQLFYQVINDIRITHQMKPKLFVMQHAANI